MLTPGRRDDEVARGCEHTAAGQRRQPGSGVDRAGVATDYGAPPHHRPSESALPDASPALLVALVVLLMLATWVWKHLQRRRLRESYERLLRRDGSLAPTTTPCGLGRGDLVDRFLATPRGDRRFGLRYGVTGELTCEVGGREQPLEAASFEWFHERRRTSHGPKGQTSTRYDEQRTPVTVVRLPVRVPDRVRLRPESVLGRIGITRGGQQVESDAFNRAFRVEASDRTLTVQLLDAQLQRRLAEEFTGRTIELAGEHLVLAGDPEHRDESLVGVVGALPAMRQDAQRLLQAVPAQFWRAVGAAG